MLNSKNKFNFLKVHTQYSICEGALKIEDLEEICKKKKLKALGICDSYNLCGALEFSEKISKQGTQPIIGSQLNFSFNNILGKVPLFAQTQDGFMNLSELSSKSYLDIDEKSKPHCKFEDLYNLNKDLIIFSGSYRDLFGKLFRSNKIKPIKDIFLKIKENFPNRFYIEIHRHGEKGEKDYEQFLLEQSKEFDLPIIASKEIFYTNKDMYEAHDALMCIGNKNFIDDKDRLKLNNNHYFLDDETIERDFKDLPEALENNYQFFKRFSFKLKKNKPKLPQIKHKNNERTEDLLSKIAHEGLKKRLVRIKEKNKKNLKFNFENIYKKRLDHEIKIINSMDYSSYFLIVSDYIKWAKNNSIPVGPGRGSGAGSLVAYCLDITDLDPIEFDLIFERFLNPDRISMPDFDIDFCEEKRDLVFEYLKSKYGNGVAHIITFGKLKARMALRDVGRVIGLPYGHVDKICKMIPFDPSRPLTLKESIDREPRFKKEIQNNKKVEKLIELSLKLEGINRNMATHAAGVVIADQELYKQVPLYKDHSSNFSLPSTQFDMYSSENAGLVKFDLLGLKTLTVIDKTIKTLKSKKCELNLENIDLDDQKVFKLLSKGETTGLFQLESTGMRDAIVQMKPNKFDDIIALIALYRPGPMSNIKTYNDCKNGLKQPEYIHPTLEKILKPTYGIIIYQEQVMQIAQTLAGFTASEADILRKAMGKKKRAELEKQKERFIKGATNNGIKKDLANFIFTKIEPFAEYGFNKSHAADYALIAFQTAYLKTYHKEDFIAETMNTELTSTEKLREFVQELKRLNIEVIRPNINVSYTDFRAINNKIYYGLGAIKNVGSVAVSQIIKEREQNGKFKSIFDFIKRTDPKNINKLQLEGLIKAGAFDDFDKNRRRLVESVPTIILTAKNIFENKIAKQNSLFDESEKNEDDEILAKNITPWENKINLFEEFKSLGFYISDHPLNSFSPLLKTLKVSNYREFLNSTKSDGLIAGTLMSIKEKKSAKGTPFAIAKFSDNETEFELFIFSETLITNRDILKESSSFILTLQKDRNNESGKFRFNLKNIEGLEKMIDRIYSDTVKIELNENYDLNDLKEILKESGNTKIKIIISKDNKKLSFDLKNCRKFDHNKFIFIKNKEYVKNIVF